MKIEHLFVYVAVLPDGRETVAAYKDADGLWPLFARGKEELAALRPWAEEVSRGLGVRLELRRFISSGETEGAIDLRN